MWEGEEEGMEQRKRGMVGMFGGRERPYSTINNVLIPRIVVYVDGYAA
jgi:hypothetical protein